MQLACWVFFSRLRGSEQLLHNRNYLVQAQVRPGGHAVGVVGGCGEWVLKARAGYAVVCMDEPLMGVLHLSDFVGITTVLMA